MYLRKFKPKTNGIRFTKKVVSFGLSNYKFTRLKIGKQFKKSRNITGNITFRNRNTFSKKSFLLVDYSRRWTNQLSLCLNLTKDKHRTCLLALIKYADGTFSYILSPHKLKPGTFLFTTKIHPNFFFKYKIGCNVLLRYMPQSTLFFNIELTLGEGGKYSRSAGTFCSIISHDLILDTVRISIPTGEVRVISIYCIATLGIGSNKNHINERFGKAGYNRILGYRPRVRGVAMNPVDNPHGGRTKTNSPEVTPWNKIAKKGK